MKGRESIELVGDDQERRIGCVYRRSRVVLQSERLRMQCRHILRFILTELSPRVPNLTIFY